MLIENDKNNRLLLFFFYDAAGIVDDYIPYMLNDMKKQVRDIFIVSNGTVTEEGKEKLKPFTDEILERDNEGFDVWAYKAAIQHFGWEQLSEYDEVILMNFTIMGPVYPFSEMFEAMAERDLDFWGVTKFHETDFDPFGAIPYGYVPDHIQSHFIVVRKSLLTSPAFQEYWENMPMIKSYHDSIVLHESTFTKKFADLGFRWEVYADSEDYRKLTYNPVLCAAKQMLRDKRCPFFKRRSFMQDYTGMLKESCGQENVELYEYLDKQTDYDMNLIWDNILRVENLADIKKNLQLNYVLPSSHVLAPKRDHSNKKIALFMHLYFIDLIDECLHYARSLPDNTDVYITTNTEEKKAAIEQAFQQYPWGRLDVILVPNAGRDVGPFLVEAKDCIMDYDYICHAHDKKVSQQKPGSIGAAFSYHCFDNLLRSSEFVENVIDTFEQNPRMGLLMTSPPNHGPYFLTLGMEWGTNYRETKKLAEKLGIHVSIKEKKEVIAPLGSFFWARPQALKNIFDYPWTYDELPKEPIKDDGTILHAVERIYGYCAQECGYYSAWLFSENSAAMEITNLNHMLRTINEKLFFKANIAGSHQDMLNQLEYKLGFASGSSCPPGLSGKIYYASKDVPFHEDRTIQVPAGSDNNKLYWDFKDLQGLGAIQNLRFDPGESGQMFIKDLKLKLTLQDGSQKHYTTSDVSSNAIPLDDMLVYLLDDPQIGVSLPRESILESITVELKIEFGIGPDISDRLRQKLLPRRNGFRRRGK